MNMAKKKQAFTINCLNDNSRKNQDDNSSNK